MSVTIKTPPAAVPSRPRPLWLRLGGVTLVAALLLLAEAAEPDAYNICAADAVAIGTLLPLLSELSGIALTPEADPALFRPSDEPLILGDTARLRAATGWVQRHDLRETVASVLAHEMAAGMAAA